MNLDFSLARIMLGILVIGCVVFIGYTSQRRLAFRADLQRIRGDLFDFMRENRFDFNSPGYLSVRDLLDGLLVMSGAGMLSAVTFVIMFYFRDSLKRAGYLASGEAVDAVRIPALKEKLLQARSETVVRMMEFVFLEGATGLAVHGILAMIGLVRSVSKTREWAKQRAEEFASVILVLNAHGIRA